MVDRRMIGIALLAGMGWDMVVVIIPSLAPHRLLQIVFLLSLLIA